MKDRTHAILNRLLDSEIPLTVRYLSTEFKVSERTIRNEISAINELLRQCQLPLVNAIRSKGLELNLSQLDRERLITFIGQHSGFKYLSREERVLDLILDIAFGKEPVFLKKKEECYQVSKSSIDEDIRQVRKSLAYYQVEVVSLPKQGLKFQAKEQFIRTMLFSMVSSVLVAEEQGKKELVYKYVDKERLHHLDTIYSNCISQVEVSPYRINFNLLTYIWLNRLSRGHYISPSNESERRREKNDRISAYISQVLREFKIESSTEEERYIYFLLNSLNKEEAYHPSNWLDLQLLIMQLIQFVEEETGIPFNKKEDQLQEALYGHMIGMVDRIKNGLQLVNPLRDKIKQAYGQVYSGLEKFLRGEQDKLGGIITDDEIAFLTIHFSTALSEINQNNQYWYRAIVICNHGIATGRLLAENLREYFNIEVLAVLSSREIDLVEKFDVDLVFSTVKLNYKAKPIMIMDTIFNEETKLMVHNFLEANRQHQRLITRKSDYTEMFQILLKTIESQFGKLTKNFYNDLENLFRKNGLTINQKEVQPMIQDVLSDDNILFEKGDFTWQEAIQQVAKPLLRKKNITEDYVQAMIEDVKKYGPYIVIGPHLALAHARPEDGANQLGLSLAIFQKPVSFGHEFNDPVKVIFCLSAVDSYSHLNIMKSLVSLIRKEDNLKKLADASNIQMVKKILFTDDSEEEK